MHTEVEAAATPLFRNEAVRFQAARLQGEVFLKIRSPWLVLGFVCAAIAIVVVAAAAMLTYDRKEHAAGALVFAEQGHLEAELRIAPTAIGFIKPGQLVRLRYDAFPDRKFGQAQGKIASISSLPTGDGSYRARVTLERDYVQAFGERVALRPGMSFSGEIVVEQRSLLEWLFEPLYALGARA
ncbi:MAG TPA: HlyD family secretion protein [Steroidobacteraceae bacterium]|nr:HlyD family secretion protein [Steroidobacteraceae bacterium]